jgi:hypothetical protein
MIVELAERYLGRPEIALLDRAGEASVCRPLTCHRQLGPALATLRADVLEGRAGVLPNLGRMYTLGLDTIAGAKLLQLKFGASGVFQSDQAVTHGARRARFIRMSDGAAIIRYWGDSQPVAVPPETLSTPGREAALAAPGTPRTQRPSATISRTLARRSSGSVPKWSLSRTIRRRLTIL